MVFWMTEYSIQLKNLIWLTIFKGPGSRQLFVTECASFFCSVSFFVLFNSCEQLAEYDDVSDNQHDCHADQGSRHSHFLPLPA
jgi:hypothetical protein